MKYNFDLVIDRHLSNSNKWNLYAEDILPMWVADMDFQVPPLLQEALHKAVDHGVFGYESPSDELLATVAARMVRVYDWKVDPEMVVAIPGLVSGFNVAAQAVCKSGEGILMQTPVYFPFLKVHNNVGLTRQIAELASDRQGGMVNYRVDWDVFETAVNSGGAPTRLFLLCNPHNPTGQIYSREDLTHMAEICAENDIAICSDEIHSELLLGGAKFTPIATLSPEIASRTITLVAPSKSFNVAGLFCGFAIIPDPDLRKRYEETIKQMTLHVASPGQISAQVAMSGVCDDWLSELNDYLTANRDYVVAYVRDNLPGVCVTMPDATHLSWLDCNEMMATGKIEGSPHEFFLKNAKVALSDGAEFGPGGEGFVRLNFGCPRSTLEEGLDRIRKSLL